MAAGERERERRRSGPRGRGRKAARALVHLRVFTGSVIAALLRPPEGRPRLLLAAHISRPEHRRGPTDSGHSLGFAERSDTTTYLRTEKDRFRLLAGLRGGGFSFVVVEICFIRDNI